MRTSRVALAELDAGEIEACYAAMEAEIGRVLREVQRDGKISFTRSADIGYLGQGYQVTVPTNDLRGAIRKEPLWARLARRIGASTVISTRTFPESSSICASMARCAVDNSS